MSIHAIVLAAGKGTRMKSPLPKVLHPVAGVPMISYVLSALRSMGTKEIRVVVGHGSDLVKSNVEPLGAQTFLQEEQLGTAHAVSAAKPEELDGDVLILNGDHPLIQMEDLQKFYTAFQESEASLALMTADLEEPGAFGRVIRHKTELRAIVEAKHASPETLKIKEINTGIYLLKSGVLKEYLPQIEMHPEKQEYYLTDLIEIAHENHLKMLAYKSNSRVAFGVNTQEELAKATKSLFQAKSKSLMQEGVVIVDPSNTYIEPTATIGTGSVVYPGAYVRGLSNIGSFCVLEPNVQIINSDIEDSVQIRAGSYLEDAKVSKKAVIGPYARLRPETEIGESARIGNFVELKKTKFGKESKANHLTYLGDAEIGENVNIGCGTITCNYAADKKKYKTKIGDGSFVGSDTQFVAPVTVGKNAIIGSGSTITKDVPDDALAVARGKQFIKEAYAKKYLKD